MTDEHEIEIVTEATKNGADAARNWIMIWAGVALTAMGFIGLNIMGYRYFWPAVPGDPQFSLIAISVALSFFFGGLMLVKTGNPGLVWKMARNHYLLEHEARPPSMGGRRKIDKIIYKEEDKNA